MTDPEKQVFQALESYKAAVRTKNADAFMRLYDPKVRVFDTWGVWAYEGAPAWRVAVEGWFASLGDEVCVVRFEDVRMNHGDGFAAMSAITTYTAVTTDGKDLRSMQNRISWVLRTSGHVLRVVHEHTSAPVGFEDAKAILVRAAP